jgi:aristolochene synthase
MRFSMGLRLSSTQQKLVSQLEQNCSRHISIVNDIYSFEKELKASLTMNEEGAALCSAVKLVSDEAGMGVEAAKRVLWSMVREWERIHENLAKDACSGGVVGGELEALCNYVKGLEFQMSGNELWSKTTPRYHEVDL